MEDGRPRKRRSSPAVSMSGSEEGEIDELLEIKPPQPKIRSKHGYSTHTVRRHGEKHSRHHKYDTEKYDYHAASSASNVYHKSQPSQRYETDRRHYPQEQSLKSSKRQKEYIERSSGGREEYKRKKHHHSHREKRNEKERGRDIRSREDRYIEEEEQALQEEVNRRKVNSTVYLKEQEMRSKLDKRRHHKREDRDYKKDNTFLQADRLKEVYRKDSEERLRRSNRSYERRSSDITPPRSYDTDKRLKSNVVVVSDESRSPLILRGDSAEEVLSITPGSFRSMSSDGYDEREQQRREMEDMGMEQYSEEEREEVMVINDDYDDENENTRRKRRGTSTGSSEQRKTSEEEEEDEDDDHDDDEDEGSSGSESESEEEEQKATSSEYEEDSGEEEGRAETKTDRISGSERLSPKSGESGQTSSTKSSEEVPARDLIYYYPALQGCRSVEQFHCLNKIEEGTYGVVYRARDKRTNQIVALKRLKMEKEKEGFPITSLREINTLLKAQHPNIVTVREIVVGSNMDKIFIVMDYVEHDLKSLMETMKQKKSSFITSEVKCLMLQLLSAVAHLHDNWILHRDLKTSNLLFSHQGILKVGDFGLAREYGSPLKHYTSVVVTLWYRAPELLLGTKLYSTPIDMWSIGCIFAEFLAMEPLFPGKSEVDQINRVFKMLGTPTEQQWPDYKKLPIMQKINFSQYPVGSLRHKFQQHVLSDLGYDLLTKFLTYNPKDRITAETALKHKYFEEHPLATDPAMFPTWPAKSEPGSGYSKLKAESPKPPSGGQGYKDLGEDEGFYIGIGERNSLGANRPASYNSTFCLKF